MDCPIKAINPVSSSSVINDHNNNKRPLTKPCMPQNTIGWLSLLVLLLLIVIINTGQPTLYNGYYLSVIEALCKSDKPSIIIIIEALNIHCREESGQSPNI